MRGLETHLTTTEETNAKPKNQERITSNGVLLRRNAVCQPVSTCDALLAFRRYAMKTRDKIKMVRYAEKMAKLKPEDRESARKADAFILADFSQRAKMMMVHGCYTKDTDYAIIRDEEFYSTAWRMVDSICKNNNSNAKA